MVGVFKWCMHYHQSDKTKHDSRLTVLKKIKDKHTYDGINFWHHTKI